MNENADEIEKLLTQINVFTYLDKQEKVFNLNIKCLKAKLLKKAILTDLMGFSPYFFGFSFIISQKVVDCLKEENVSRNEYHLFKVDIRDVSDNYFLFFVPMIPTSEIIFDKSNLFLENEFLQKKRKKLNIRNLGDYQEFTMKNPFVSFDKICLDKKYVNNSIINSQGATKLFFSESLIKRFKAENVTSFIEPNRQTRLIFD